MIHIHVYMYMYIYMYVCVYIIYIYRHVYVTDKSGPAEGAERLIKSQVSSQSG